MEFQFESLADMFEMSGHGVYVWSCYAITALGLGYLALSPLRQRRVLFNTLKRQARIAEHEAKQQSVGQ